ncbi:MAG: hypothetical protein HUK08_08300 [Bacteroidaceae bacterium]|nr:hypothetical protein [Bacteroidaceae bacterium]
MEDYRFHLDNKKPRRKFACPSCHRQKCFTPYVDDEGLVTFPEGVGICDHVNSCGYHFSPSEYFRDHPEALNRQDHGTTCRQRINRSTKHDPKPDYIDKETMNKSFCKYDTNPLFLFLAYVFGERKAMAICRRYNVGTANKWGGSTVYWQVDKDGNVRAGKIMLYAPDTGHRVKDERYGARVNWVHSELKMHEFHLQQCLYGEHLLTLHPDKTVMLVESEKSALIASQFVPEYLWMATGGMQGCFNPRALRALKGRDVILFPDLGAYDVWKSKIPMLQPVCKSVRISSFLEERATEEQRRNGLDIADYLLMEPTERMVFHDMCKRNPGLKLLQEELQLELVEDDSPCRCRPPPCFSLATS